MKKLKLVMDAADPIIVIENEDGTIAYGLEKEETKGFQELLDSVEKRFSVKTICGEYYETIGFETQQEKDELIEDTKKLFNEIIKYLGNKYIIDNKPDLTAIYRTPAGMREQLRENY